MNKLFTVNGTIACEEMTDGPYSRCRREAKWVRIHGETGVCGVHTRRYKDFGGQPRIRPMTDEDVEAIKARHAEKDKIELERLAQKRAEHQKRIEAVNAESWRRHNATFAWRRTETTGWDATQVNYTVYNVEQPNSFDQFTVIINRPSSGEAPSLAVPGFSHLPLSMTSAIAEVLQLAAAEARSDLRTEVNGDDL